METETILHAALFSGILGFLVFCASYAFHVWRSRNAATRQKTATTHEARLLRWSLLSIGLGCVLMFVSFIWREVKPREGVLFGDGLFTVRAEQGLKLEYVTPARTVATGDVLARFRSPERRAEMTEVELKRQIVETQRKVVELQPLTPDNDLVRRYEKCVADQRQLLASLTYLIPEHAVVIREKLRDRLDKTERINALTTRIESARRELQQAMARRQLADKRRTRLERLFTGAAADIELDERSTESVVQETEVSKLQTSLANMEVERKHLQNSMPVFAACTSQQAEDIGHELIRVREQLTANKQELSTSSKQLERDRTRAERLKSEMLAQLDLEIRQCQAKLEGIQEVLTIKAPFAGIVAYADPAPATALPMAPVVILTPEQGFRFRLRMTEAEIGPLSRTGSVTLGLVTPILQRRFAGQLIKWDRLQHEPGYVLAELSCMPPPETIRDLAAHDWGAHDWVQMPTVKVRLLWQPPVQVTPVFYPAICMLAVGLTGICAAWLQRSYRRSRADTSASPKPAENPVSRPQANLPAELIAPLLTTGPALDAVDVESGAAGRNLLMLGQRFRESIKRQSVEPALLRAMEWAIDRHHTRAIQHLATGLDHDPELPSSLQRLLQGWNESEENKGEQERTADRMIRIVRAVAPELLGELQPLESAGRTSAAPPPAFARPVVAPSIQAQAIKNATR